MLAYIYDSETFEYKYSIVLQRNPISGGYMFPSYSTTKVVPPYGEGEIAIFNVKEDRWMILPDYRGELQINLATEEFSVIHYIGYIEEGYQLVTKIEYENYLKHPERFAVVDGKWINIYGDDPAKEDYSYYSLTKREVFLALYADKGITPEMIRARITDIPAQIEFDYAERYYRGNPLINQIGKILGYTPQQLDFLFKYGHFDTEQSST